MYPMIPHIFVFLDPCSGLRRRALFPLDPALDIRLLAAGDAEGSRRDILRNRRARSHVGALADRDRRNQLRIAPDEGTVLDDRLVFSDAVVVTGNRPRADVDVV